MATRPPSQRTFWVFIITLPFWTNLLIRTYAMFVILRDEGFANWTLAWFWNQGSTLAALDGLQPFPAYQPLE